MNVRLHVYMLNKLKFTKLKGYLRVAFFCLIFDIYLCNTKKYNMNADLIPYKK